MSDQNKRIAELEALRSEYAGELELAVEYNSFNEASWLQSRINEIDSLLDKLKHSRGDNE